MTKILHLLPNAHLDPVWLWDWLEGLNEGLTTCRTMLDLMDEEPDLTFIRGEAAIYEFIERTDPATFRRIRQAVKRGRWDYVGGTYVQPDTNLPDTETFARHFLRGQSYFKARFGQPVTVAWAADSFGHSAGLPEILARAGIQNFAFTRPWHEIPTAFWWEAPSGARVLAYHPLAGGYCTERERDVPRILDEALKIAPHENVGVFFGLGNHGGGATRRHLADIRQWAAAHPEAQVVFSGLHRFFAALRREAQAHGAGYFPVRRGELNFTQRGCYSSAARLKFQYRKTEAALRQTETTDTVISAALKRRPADLVAAWDAALFNSFHDILPGSSIERAYDDQFAWLGSAWHACRGVSLDALNALAARIDTRVPPVAGDRPCGIPVLLWNAHPHPYEGYAEIEASLDYRPIKPYENQVDQLPVRVLDSRRRPVPFQVVAPEHHAFASLAWRTRVVAPVKVPACGWALYQIAWVEGAEVPASADAALPASADGADAIDNGLCRIEATVGGAGVRILQNGRALLDGAGLGAVTAEDPWGSWGPPDGSPEGEAPAAVRHVWKITNRQVLERGPERACLWVRLEAGHSRLDLSFLLYRGREGVEVRARVFWNERAARLKLVLPAGDQAEFDVPGGRITRPPCGEVPGGHWVRISGPRGTLGFASDALYNFAGLDGIFYATIVRASRYADSARMPVDFEPWRPACDCGELRFKFFIGPGDARLPVWARELEQPLVAQTVTPSPGLLPRSGSLLELAPMSVRLLACKPAQRGPGFILRVQAPGNEAVRPKLTFLGKKVTLHKLRAGEIATWRLRRAGDAWRADAVLITEEPAEIARETRKTREK